MSISYNWSRISSSIYLYLPMGFFPIYLITKDLGSWAILESPVNIHSEKLLLAVDDGDKYRTMVDSVDIVIREGTSRMTRL